MRSACAAGAVSSARAAETVLRARPLAVVLLLLACACGGGTAAGGGPAASAGEVAILGVSPASVSARGGSELTIHGRGFSAPLAVALAGRPAEVLSVDAGELRVRVPRLTAGPADVAVAVGERPAVVAEGALAVVPLALRFVAVPEEDHEAPEAGEVNDAVALDVDADGDPDLVLATDDGLRVLLNDGAGRFALLRDAGDEAGPARPGGRGAVRALAVGDLDGDGARELVACTAAGRELRFSTGISGLTELGGPPLRSGGCRAAVVLDADGDGALDLATVVEAGAAPPSLALLLGNGSGGLAPSDAVAPPSEELTPVGTATANDPSATLSFARSLEDPAEGRACARASFSFAAPGASAVFALPARLPAVPDTLRLQLRADGSPVAVAPALVDAGGTIFEGPPLALAAGRWTPVETTSVASWAPEGAVPPLDVAIVIASQVDGPVEGELSVDAVTASARGFMPWAVDDFERRAPRHVLAGAARLLAGDLDGDGRDDLVALGGDGAILLLTRGGAPGGSPFRPSAAPLGGAGPFVAGALLDADGDGDLDLLLASAGGQDRLLLGDGWGRFLDATPGSLPLDWAEGRAVAAADLDLDGAPDVVVGNRAGTDRLYRGRGDGRFLDATPDLGFDEQDTAAVVVADLDGDGDDDLVSVARTGARPLVRLAVEVER